MKKWVIGAFIALLAIATIAAVMIVKQNDTPPAGSETISIAEDCWKHVTDMNVVDQEDGTVEVTLTAPDYVSLVKLLAGEGNDNVTSEHITKAVKNNPETVKGYTFTASSSEETDIKNALMEQISYDLVDLTLEDMYG